MKYEGELSGGLETAVGWELTLAFRFAKIPKEKFILIYFHLWKLRNFELEPLLTSSNWLGREDEYLEYFTTNFPSAHKTALILI